MKQIYFLLLFIITDCLGILDIDLPSNDFRNVRVIRLLDLSTPIIKEDIAIHAKNTAQNTVDAYYFILPEIYMPFIASFTANSKQGNKDPLQIESVAADMTQQIHIFKIHLNDSILPDQDVKIGISLIYTHLVRPFPEKIPQVSKQHVSFKSNIYLLSAYPSDNMKSTFTFPSPNIVSFAGGEPNHTGQKTQNKITYGSFNDIKPLSHNTGTFHYEYQPPIITIKTLKRELELSHWGNNLAVEEHYSVTHDGAKLDQEFNRIQYQLDPHVLVQTNVLNKMVFQLPKDASGAYYRDEVGNVSTSNFRNEQDKSVLEIQPRFPLFGGWKTTWYLGYNVPLKYFVRYVKGGGGEYILKFLFVENVQSMTIEDAQVKVILPEGSSHIVITIPDTFGVDSIKETTHYTYFDSTGRPTIILHKKNVVSKHEQPILISYHYSSSRLLQKPIVASGFFFLIFLMSIFISKLPWAINDQEINAEKEVTIVLDEPVVIEEIKTSYVKTVPHYKEKKHKRKGG
ncbi:Ribophorin I [Helicostylum pulchrum]|nr:Ribophorin I [Helicostylum pulchrum]